MTPTNHTVITREGMQRKMDRMIARDLQKRFPEIYNQLFAEAQATMRFDQANPFATVIGRNTPGQSPLEKAIRANKRQLMKQAIDTGKLEVVLDTRIGAQS